MRRITCQEGNPNFFEATLSRIDQQAKNRTAFLVSIYKLVSLSL
jgi:hypothetical protein